MKVEEIKHNQLKDYKNGQEFIVENVVKALDKKTKKPKTPLELIYISAGIVSLVGVWGDWVVWRTQEDKEISERLSHLKTKTRIHILNK